jgi:hypothetical protein
MPPVAFEPMIPLFEGAKTFHALTATVIGNADSSLLRSAALVLGFDLLFSFSNHIHSR